LKFAIVLALLWAPPIPAQTVSAQRTSRPAADPSNAPPPPTVRPEDKCSVEGTAVNALTGEPLNKVHLMLRSIGQPNGVPYGTTSDGSGHFLLDDVDPGRYSLSASRNGYVNQAYSSDGNFNRPTMLTLGNGQKLKEIVFKLAPQGVIAGRVVDQDGEALARVQVSAMTFRYLNGKRQAMNGGATSTNDLGEFRIFGLRPGKYVLSATYQSNGMVMQAERAVGSAQAVQAADEGYATTYYPNSPTTEGASRIEIYPGAQIQGLEMKLVQSRTYRIKGQVSGLGAQSKRNPPFLQLMRREEGSGFFGGGRAVTQVTDPKGTFEIRNVPPGPYVIVGFYNDQEGLSLTARATVDVGNANVEGVVVTFQPPFHVTGHVVVEANGDLGSAVVNVFLEPKSGGPRMGGGSAAVNDDLTFKVVNVAQDVFGVNVFGIPPGFYVKTIRMGEQDVTASGVDFTQGPPAGELTIVVNPNGEQIDGNVQNAKGENAAATMVTLIPEESAREIAGAYKTASTDQTGRFTIKGIRPGEYKIYAWEEIENGAYQDPEFMKPHESAGKTVSVKESGHETVQLTAIPAENSATAK